jgi:hypothetical protein
LKCLLLLVGLQDFIRTGKNRLLVSCELRFRLEVSDLLLELNPRLSCAVQLVAGIQLTALRRSAGLSGQAAGLPHLQCKLFVLVL